MFSTHGFKNTWLSLSLLFIAVGAAPTAFAESGDAVDDTLKETAYFHQPNDAHFSAGQPTLEQLHAFAEHGVRHVIDLRPPQEAPDLNNPAQVSQAGMAYYHIAIAGGDDLTREHVEVLDTILQRVGDDKVLLHCASANRVGAMMALHAAWFKDASEDEAVELGKRYGLTSLETSVRDALND